jgi:hypothetical protein
MEVPMSGPRGSRTVRDAGNLRHGERGTNRMSPSLIRSCDARENVTSCATLHTPLGLSRKLWVYGRVNIDHSLGNWACLSVRWMSRKISANSGKFAIW